MNLTDIILKKKKSKKPKNTYSVIPFVYTSEPGKTKLRTALRDIHKGGKINESQKYM